MELKNINQVEDLIVKCIKDQENLKDFEVGFNQSAPKSKEPFINLTVNSFKLQSQTAILDLTVKIIGGNFNKNRLVAIRLFSFFTISFFIKGVIRVNNNSLTNVRFDNTEEISVMDFNVIVNDFNVEKFK